MIVMNENTKFVLIISLVTLLIGVGIGTQIMQINTVSQKTLRVEIEKTLQLQTEQDVLSEELKTATSELERVETKYEKLLNAVTSPMHLNPTLLDQLNEFDNITIICQNTNYGDKMTAILRENCNVLEYRRYANYGDISAYLRIIPKTSAIIFISTGEIINFLESLQQLDTPVYAVISDSSLVRVNGEN